jgi:hypothetical protein
MLRRHGDPLPDQTSPAQAAMSRAARLLAVAAALGLLAAFAVAVAAKPDPRGYGTHQHFGLPPCSFRFLFGRPCPTCGMTTAWANLIRGRLAEAMHANIGGALLGVTGLIALPWLIVSAVRGRWWFGRPKPQWIGTVAIVIGGLTLVQWIVRLILG